MIEDAHARQRSELAPLLFTAFIHVAAAEGDVSPHDVQSFVRLLEQPDWTSDTTMRAGLEQVRADYVALWSGFDGSRLPADLGTIAARLDGVLQALAENEARDFRVAFGEYVQRAARPAAGALTRLWPQAATAAKSKAREQLERLLNRPVPLQAVAPAPEVAISTPASASAPAPAFAPAPVLAPAPAGALAPAPAATATATAPAIPPAAPAPTAATVPPSAPKKDPAAGKGAASATAVSAETVALWPAAGTPLAADHCWSGGRIALRCVDVTDETADVKTFSFVSDPPRLFAYRPGQFALVELPIGGKTVKRSYSISSSPSRPHVLSITVKRIPNGVGSQWLHDHLGPGMSLEISGPLGTFSCLNHPSPKLLLMCAEAGVTPTMSMLRWLVDTRAVADVALVSQVDTPQDIVFRRELQHLCARAGSTVRATVVPRRIGAGQSWHGVTGAVSERLLSVLVPDIAEREIFVCGPAAFLKQAKAALEPFGLDSQRVHSESFGGPTEAKAGDKSPAAAAPASPPAPVTPPVPIATPVPVEAPSERPAAAVPAPTATVPAGGTQIVFQRSRRTIACGSAESILEIAESHGIPLPHSCRSGVCGSCRVRKLGGAVRMECSQALSVEEVDAGYVLTCVGRASGAVVLDA